MKMKYISNHIIGIVRETNHQCIYKSPPPPHHHHHHHTHACAHACAHACEKTLYSKCSIYKMKSMRSKKNYYKWLLSLIYINCKMKPHFVSFPPNWKFCKGRSGCSGRSGRSGRSGCSSNAVCGGHNTAMIPFNNPCDYLYLISSLKSTWKYQFFFLLFLGSSQD